MKNEMIKEKNITMLSQRRFLIRTHQPTSNSWNNNFNFETIEEIIKQNKNQSNQNQTTRGNGSSRNYIAKINYSIIY